MLKRFSNKAWFKLLILALTATVFLELYIRGDLMKTLTWFWTHPNMLLLNIGAMAGVTALVHGLLNRWKGTTAAVMTLAYLYGTINSLKFKTLGQYYYPWDNGMVSELGGVSKNLANLDYTKPLLFLGLGLLIGGWLMHSRFFSGAAQRMALVPRALAFCLAGLVLGSFVLHKEWKLDPALNALGVRNYAWAPVHSYQNNGALAAYLINYRMNYVEKPENYSREQIEAIIDSVAGRETVQQERDDATTRPNIIVVMSEALWDPNQLTDIRFSQDPMAHLNAAKKATFVSPTFGGYTCNVEFEFLTGMTMKFLPPTSVPYQHFIKKSMPSLPNELKQNGYATSAIHPYHPWFWGRDKVYPLLGFDEFLAEEAFADAPKRGYYVSDDSVMDKIIDRIEATEEPLFVFAVTMQNHGPFKDDRYKGTELTLTGPDPAMKEQILDTYTQGVLEADRAFKRLTDYVAASEEPTLVVQFGDHLPSLGDSFEMYRKYGYLRPEADSYQAMTPEEQLKIRTTQVSAFSNYQDFALPEYVSPSMLSARVLAYTGVEMSDYYRMLSGLTERFSCIYGQNIITNDGEVTRMDDQMAKAYWQLQYDLLVGKQYFKEIEAARALQEAPRVGRSH